MLSMSVNTLEPIIECEINPFLSADRETPSYVYDDQVKAVRFFHQSLPSYFPTPLVNLEELASRLGINALMVKDESQRFGLKAFKVLGASYAMSKEIQKRLDLNDEELNFDAIIKNKPDGWRGNKIKEKTVKIAIKKALKPFGFDEAKIEEIFKIAKEQDEY